MKQFIMLSYGELGTKGKNKIDFIRSLRKDVAYRLKKMPTVKIENAHDRIYISVEENLQDVIAILKRISGIANIVIGNKIERDASDFAVVKELVKEKFRDLSGTFKVKAQRADKLYPLDSQQINQIIGGIVLDSNSNMKVNLFEPDYTLGIEIRKQGIFVYLEKIKGIGGYPLGTLGRGLLMLSGGIDSPVAGYQLIRRGIIIEAIHFASPPYTSEEVIDKIQRLLSKLNDYQPRIILHIVPFTKMQMAIRKEVSERYNITVMRRMMYRISEQVARRRHADIIASGESIGQVASQTLKSIDVIGKVLSIPHIRPLALVDKEEIIRQAKHIDTYDISIEPFTDCCTIFTPINPVTQPREEEVLASEEKFDYQALIEEIMNDITTIEIQKD